MALMNEGYYSGEIARTAYSHENQPASLYATLQTKFPWVKPEEYYAISEAAMHEVLQEPVITCNLPYPASEMLAGPGAAMVARKFCMDSGTSFLRVYRLPKGDKPNWMPEDAKWLLWGENFQEYGRPFNPIAKTFKDYYFGGTPEIIESHFNLPVRRGAYETFYGVTEANGQVVRVKQYCYEEQGVFSDWDVAFISLCKRHSRPDLL